MINLQSHFNKLLGDWNNKSLSLEKFNEGDVERYKYRDDNLKLHFNRFNELDCFNKYFDLNKKYNILDFSCGNGATLEIFRHFNNNVTGVDYKDNYNYKKYIKSQDLMNNYIEHDGIDIPYPFTNNEFDMVVCWGALYHYEGGPTEKTINFIDDFTRISKDIVVIALNSVEHRPNQKDKDLYFKNQLINYNKNNFKFLIQPKNYIFILKKSN